MNIRRLLTAAAATTGIIVAFGAALSLSPYASGPGSSAFVHGLARGGFGVLRADWFAGTHDPSPLFSFMVFAVYRKLSPALFLAGQASLIAIYVVSLLSLGKSAAGVSTPGARRIFILLLITVHAVALSSVPLHLAGIDLRDILTGGAGGMSLPGSALDPAAFGVFLVASVALFLNGRSYAAGASAAFAACMDPRYSIVAFSLVITYAGVLVRERAGVRQIAGPAALALTMLAGGAAYWHHIFKPESLRDAAVALGMLRMAPAFFAGEGVLDVAGGVVKAVILLAALYASRPGRLFHVIPGGIVLAPILTVAVAGSASPSSVNPWAAAAVFVPVGITVIAALAARRAEAAWTRSGAIRSISGLIVLLLCAFGIVATAGRFRGRDDARDVQDYVRASKDVGDVYLVPPEFSSFRTTTGAAIVADANAVPATTADIGEWERRMNAVTAFYGALTPRACADFAGFSSAYGMTHVVLRRSGPGVTCTHLDTLYADSTYCLCRVSPWHGPRLAPAAVEHPWVTGYYGYWGEEEMPPPAMHYSGLTHIVHFFARPEMSPSPYFGPVVNPADSMQLVWGTDHYTVGTYNVMDSLLVYAHRSGVKVVLSVGGVYGTQAEVIDFITHDSLRTQAFVDAALGFARRHGYDGVELDWERPMSAAQVSLIVRRLRAGLNTWPVRGLLFVASAGWDMRLKTYDPALVASAIDQFNIMGYDLHMPGNLIGSNGDLSDVTGFNAALHRPDSTRYPVIYTLADTYDGVSHPAYIDHGQLFLSGYNKLRFGPRYAISVLGFPAGKVGIGIPFYGYIYKNRTAPGQPRAGSTPTYLSYKTTLAALRSGGTRVWDDHADVPWVTGTATAKFGQWGISVDPGTPFYITYDDTQSVRMKVRWAKDLHLGGIMLYDLWYGWVPGAEPPDPLLRSVLSEISHVKRLP